MAQISFRIIKPEDNININLIADWYFIQWKIPKEQTIQKIKSLSHDSLQLQVLMLIDNIPIATGGLYNHINLLDKEPKFKVYKKWLALVYTIPERRGQGLGYILCEHIQEQARALGIKEMYLFTDTAERLYARLGWGLLERLSVGERNIVIMKKEL